MVEIKVGTIDDVPEGSGKTVEVDGKAIALFNINGEIYAIDNACLHRGGSLGDGFIDGETITCPLHGFQFNIPTGQGVSPPSPGVKSYSVEVRDNEIYIEV